MSRGLKPWVRRVFELIVHAEIHLREGGDFDRRMAHVGFDNAIEVGITTYLSLNPIQRGGRTYKREDVQNWTRNYHAKLAFLEKEAKDRDYSLKVPNDEVIFYHEIRNNQYHAGGPGVPEAEHIGGLRTAALDAFAMLFDVDDVEQVLEHCVAQRTVTKAEQPNRDPTVDALIDMLDEPVFVAGHPYAVSEVLYATDPDAYQAVASGVTESRNIVGELSDRYPKFVRPDISHIGFVHHEDVVYLKVVDVDGGLSLTDTRFVADIGEDGSEILFFSPSQCSDQNAELLISKFSPYSIMNCFDLFTDEAAARIGEAHQADRLESLFPSPHDGGEATA